MSNCRHHWSLKGVRCPYCVDELIKSKDRELATAKAENGRLFKITKDWLNFCNGLGIEIPRGKEDEGMQKLQRLNDLIFKSSSNALDYWQGEIRKAREEEERELIYALSARRYRWVPDAISWMKSYRLKKSRQSNQSKGEKAGVWSSVPRTDVKALEAKLSISDLAKETGKDPIELKRLFLTKKISAICIDGEWLGTKSSVLKYYSNSKERKP